jgi:hypothetical protein
MMHGARAAAGAAFGMRVCDLMTGVGEGREATADHVIGVFAREVLNPALASTHRAGYGPQTRVLDGKRGDAGQQLARAGLRVVDGDAPAGADLLIVVTAPGRTAKVSELFARLGAERIILATRQIGSMPARTQAPLLSPDIRIGGDADAAH